MRSVLEAIGYTQCYSDASIYIYVKDNVRIILPVFVDDMTFASKLFKSHLEMTVNAQLLLCNYLITDLGDDSQCTRCKAVQLQIKYLSR